MVESTICNTAELSNHTRDMESSLPKTRSSADGRGTLKRIGDCQKRWHVSQRFEFPPTILSFQSLHPMVETVSAALETCTWRDASILDLH